ncbi:DUF4390 domain-containing protein [Pelomonas sp. V22]|uniref:DUF4390 domain-containing protein n=1 Tax=Pelomonas sp. V22 TaxID=2822139 RepID=UPI0024A94A55|nr:DUF4390 domain-containing protein [Pelomonas sp. V22]MDI4634888.1 DUF4390 domain-containing protein [Pelomonas sp. V22]
MRRRRFVSAASLLLSAALLGSAAPALAQGIELLHLKTEKAEEALELSFSGRFELPRAVEEALMKGVPIYFTAEVSVFRNRWYWRDARVGRVNRTWRLTWQALTRQYRISTGGLNQNFSSLAEAMNSLRNVNGWRVAEARELDDDGRYYLEFSYRLDTSQLPKPMQIGLGLPQGWALGVERTLSLNADLTLRQSNP